MKICLLTLFFLISSVAHATNPFEGSLSEALKKAEAENKELLLFFTASWCGPCAYFKKIILPDEEVANHIDDKYILITVDIDEPSNQSLVQAYNVTGVPQFFVVDSLGYTQKHLEGSPTKPKEFITQLNESSVEPSKQLSESLISSDFLVGETETIVSTTNDTSALNGFDKILYRLYYGKWKVGLTFGPKFSYMSGDYAKIKAGYNVELSAERHVNRFIFHTGISFNSSGGGNSTHSIKNHNIRLPLGVGFDITNHNFVGRQPIKLFVTPYAQYALSQYKGMNLKPWDIGAKYSLKIEMGSFDFGVYYETGFINQSNTADEAIFNRGFGVDMSIVFGR